MMIRPLAAADLEAVAALFQLVYDWDVTPDEMLRAYRLRPPGLELNLVAEGADGALLGYGSAGKVTWSGAALPPGMVRLGVTIHPDHRRRGAGRAVCRQLEGWARERGARRLQSGYREDDPGGAAFAAGRGYTEHHREFDSELDLGQFDWDRFAGVEAAAAAGGITLTTLGRVGVNEANLRTLWQLHDRLFHQAPAREHLGSISFAQFRARVVDEPGFDPEAVALALDGERWIGLSGMSIGRDGKAYTWLTAVEAAYRGRQIALALKLLTFRRARERAVTVLRTTNHSQNAAMLAINRKLGYRPKPAWVTVERHLEGQELPPTLPNS